MNFTLSIEGGEGTGKSSIVKLLEEHFTAQGLDFITTREPGGVRISEAIRKIILSKEYSEMDPRTEALLFAAARRQHYVEKIVPALQQGKIIIIDRFLDSSLVYQGHVRGIGEEAVLGINEFALDGFRPDLTILLDMGPEAALDRINQNPDREVNKLDLEKMEFHHAVRKGYLALAKKYPQRIVLVDASERIEKVADNVINLVQNRIK